MEPEQSNESLLGTLRQRLQDQSLSVEAVRAVVSEFDSTDTKTGFGFSFIKLLYIIGGVIVSLGIVFFVGQIWSDIGSLGRILVTFGLGLLLAGYGTHFMRTQPSTMLGDVLHAIAGLLLPGGALVVLEELGSGINSVWPVIIVFAAVAALYLLLLRVLTGSILVFYAIANSTIALTLLFAELFPRADQQVYLLYSMVVGVVYVYLSFAFKADWNRYLTALLSLVGAATFYISAFMSIFDGRLFYNSGHSLFWELLFPVLALGGMALATKVHSRILLFVTTVALIAYIIYLTNEYFADSVGWPLSLVVLGFVIIGIGYASIKLGKSYH
jgi:hypothetical protein